MAMGRGFSAFNRVDPGWILAIARNAALAGAGRLENAYSSPFPFARRRAFQPSRLARRKMPRVVPGNPGSPASCRAVNQLRMRFAPGCMLAAGARTIRPVPAWPDGLRRHADGSGNQPLRSGPSFMEDQGQACRCISVMNRQPPHGPAGLAQGTQNIGWMPVAARRFFLC